MPDAPALVIRPEQPWDLAAVRTVNVAAFSYAGEHREQEADLVDALRASAAFAPGLSLVATVGGEVVGHVLFSLIVIETADGDVPALALAPLAVLRGHERLRIGTRLVQAGLAEARRQGHRVVIVLGHPKYYRRLGFRPAVPLGVHAPWPGAGDAFMALELTPAALDGVRGTVRYSPAFDAVS
jgi:putative acetyltransferase